MAWNEPGGSGGKDPWTGRSGDQGPPDLDEIVKKLQEKLRGLFGGKSGGGGGKGAGGTGGTGGMGLWLLVGGALVIWLLSGIYIVDPAERGVVLRFGKYVDTTDAGPHWAPRFIETVEKVDVEQNRTAEIGFRQGGRRASTVNKEALMLTEDENIVDIELAVQYRVSSAKDFLFNVRDPEETLKQATESSLREVVGKNKLDFVLTGGRSEIAADVKDLLQDILVNRYKTGLSIISVNMQQAAPPNEVKEAFDDAIRAREDEQRFKNQALAYEKDIIPKAHGQATRQVEDANAYKAKVVAEAEGEAARFSALLAEYAKAPGVTRDRLYVETIERVLSSTTKVLVDIKGGNNLVYLPLDRLVAPSHELEPPLGRTAKPSEMPSSPTQATSVLGGTSRGRSRGDR